MKPKPVHTKTVCSACGLDWDRHSKETLVECVELLKADLAREKLRTAPRPALPHPFAPYPYPVRPFTPYPGTWQPTWVSRPAITVTSGSGGYSSPNTGGGNYQ